MRFGEMESKMNRDTIRRCFGFPNENNKEFNDVKNDESSSLISSSSNGVIIENVGGPYGITKTVYPDGTVIKNVGGPDGITETILPNGTVEKKVGGITVNVSGSWETVSPASVTGARKNRWPHTPYESPSPFTFDNVEIEKSVKPDVAAKSSLFTQKVILSAITSTITTIMIFKYF